MKPQSALFLLHPDSEEGSPNYVPGTVLSTGKGEIVAQFATDDLSVELGQVLLI